MQSTFFTGFLSISSPMTIGILVLFVLILALVYYMQRKGVAFGKRVIWGTILGAVLGIIVQILAGFPGDPMKVTFVRESTLWFSLIGSGFIDLVRMLVIPIVFVSIVHVILSMKEEGNLNKLVSTTVRVALSMVAIAAFVGLALGTVFGLGEGHSIVHGAAKAREVQPIVTTFRHLLPANPVDSMVHMNVIAVVIFAVFIGAVARMIIRAGVDDLAMTRKIFDEAYKIVMTLADLIISFMPYGVVGLLATTLAQRGVYAIMDMIQFVILLYVGVFIMFIVQAILIRSYGVSPAWYFKQAKSVLLLAFTSRSSMGVLPVTVETLTKKLNVGQTTASTVASFGTTAGMQGCAGVFPALCIVYIMNVTGMQMDVTSFIMSIIVVAVGSLGIAGIPGTATMAASVSITGVGLGSFFSSISPILAIDPLIDMARTMLNVSGSMTNAIVVDKILKKSESKSGEQTATELPHID